MRIRNKILLSFSISSIVLIAVAFVFMYWLFSRYREEDFQQKQNLKIQTTIELLDRFKKESEEISSLLDSQDINDFYDEKLLVYDQDKELIFSSLDNLEIITARDVLNQLSPVNRWVETKEGNYDLVGIYTEKNNKGYYALSKAYDAFGYDNLNFLKRVLIVLFFAISFIILIISVYLSNNLSKPINKLASLLSRYNLSHLNNGTTAPLDNKTSTKELQYLTERFNELLERTKEAFAFQKNTANHISHQLKTPVAVLVSELEKVQQSDAVPELKAGVNAQMRRAKSLGDIIDTLLEISQIESGKDYRKEVIRIDEMLFDLLEQSGKIYPDFQFQLVFRPETFTEAQMEISGNDLLLRQAFQNLMTNAALYSTEPNATITIDSNQPNEITISIANPGQTLTEEEQQSLFSYFFRGQNAFNKSGNGLGLVLSEKIIHIHNGSIRFSSANGFNVFHTTFRQ